MYYKKISFIFFNLILAHRVMAVLSVVATIQTIIIFKMSLKCLSQNLEIIDNVKIVNPHITVEKIVWNVLMDIIVVIIA